MTHKTYSILTAGGISQADLTLSLTTEDKSKYIDAWSAISTLVDLGVIEEAQAHDPSGSAYMASSAWLEVCQEDGIERPDIQPTVCRALSAA